MTHIHRVFLAALLANAPLLAFAQDPDVAAAIEMRQHGFKDMGAAFKGIRDQFRRPKPMVVMMREYTRPLTRYSKEPVLEKWFPAGSGPEAGIETQALPIIWEKPREFAARWQDYVEAAGNLQAAVSSGDLDVTRQRTRVLGKTCGGCHDTFRLDED